MRRGCLSSTLMYGDTTDGKTALAGSWAKAIFAVTGKRIRYYTAEPGGTSTIELLEEAGILEITDILPSKYPAEAINQVAQGYWPDVNGVLQPPSVKVWEEVGGVIHEGGTSYSEMLLEELRQKGAMNEITGAERAPQQYISGGTRIAGANQTFYGIAQARMRKAINDSQMLPCHVLWTCRERKVDDEKEVSGFREIYGPQLAGAAMTPHAPAWFGRTIHIDTVQEQHLDPLTKKMAVVPVKRAFLKTHFYDGDKTPFVANLRLDPMMANLLPESLLINPDGSTMSTFYQLVADARKKVLDSFPKKP